MRVLRAGILAIPVVLLIAGCTNMWQAYSGGERRGVSSSLVDYLYPDGGTPPPPQETIPQLQVPLRAGIAFVPAASAYHNSVISEATRTELLERVRSQFIDRDYIADIEVIPDSYMRSGRGFASLEQLGRLYSLDVIALVSYDQVVASDDTTASFLYWTIIGAYLVEGSKNDVQTFVDTAVFDIPTRRLLFRAPGIDKRTSRSTLVESAEELRDLRAEGFSNAIGNMSANLTVELEKFEQKIKEEPTVAQVVRRDGGGGGSVLLFDAILLFYVLLATRRSRERGNGRRHQYTSRAD